MDAGADGPRRRSYYALLRLRPGASGADVRAAYKKQAMKWHPDRWSTKDKKMGEEAKRRFQAIQHAYQVLSHESKRTLYDLGFYDDDETEEEVEGTAGFMQEMLGMMEEVRSEGRSYGLTELWGMLQDMGAHGGTDVSGAPPPVAPSCHDEEQRPRKRSWTTTSCNAFGFGTDTVLQEESIRTSSTAEAKAG